MWKNKPGYFISVEGPEGSGKSTQIPELAEYLRGLGLDVLTTREPGGTNISDQIRQVILELRNTDMNFRTETLLFQAARAQIVHEVFLPNLKNGVLILCDRFADSTRAYQGFGHGQDIGILNGLINFATEGLEPDLAVLLDVDVTEGLKRRQVSGGEWNRLDAARIEFHERVRTGYLELAKREPERWLIIDAAKTIKDVEMELRQKIVERLTSEGYLEGNHRGPER